MTSRKGRRPVDRQRRVEPPDLGAQGLRGLLEGSVRADDERHRAEQAEVGHLRGRYEDVRRGPFRQGSEAEIPDDADDGRGRVAADPQPAADGARPGPVVRRHGLVDEDRRRGARPVEVRLELAAGDDRNLERPEVAGSDDGRGDLR